MIQKAYKYRIYPNEEQKQLLEQHFGAVRWIYNYGLELRIKEYEKTQKTLNYYELSKLLPELKKQEKTQWLKNIQSQTLQMSLRNLDNAFFTFFKKQNSFPKFKAKHRTKKSVQFPQIFHIDFNLKKIKIPKIGFVDFALDRSFIGKMKTCTVSMTPTNKYFISILVEEDKELPIKPKVEQQTTIGIDLGLKNFIITSNRLKIANPKYLRQSEQLLKVLQRQHSKKKKGSKNREQSRIRLVQLYERITNQRKDFLHKLTYKLTHENQVNSICMEDLNVEGMLKNHCLAKSISDASWSMFKTFLTYKSDWYSKNLVTIGRFEPSSKMCSVCGYIKKDLILADREWICPICGTKHDRDINAANNIKKFGLIKQLGVEVPSSSLNNASSSNGIPPSYEKKKLNISFST